MLSPGSKGVPLAISKRLRNWWGIGKGSSLAGDWNCKGPGYYPYSRSNVCHNHKLEGILHNLHRKDCKGAMQWCNVSNTWECQISIGNGVSLWEFCRNICIPQVCTKYSLGLAISLKWEVSSSWWYVYQFDALYLVLILTVNHRNTVSMSKLYRIQCNNWSTRLLPLVWSISIGITVLSCLLLH